MGNSWEKGLDLARQICKYPLPSYFIAPIPSPHFTLCMIPPYSTQMTVHPTNGHHKVVIQIGIHWPPGSGRCPLLWHSSVHLCPLPVVWDLPGTCQRWPVPAHRKTSAQCWFLWGVFCYLQIVSWVFCPWFSFAAIVANCSLIIRVNRRWKSIIPNGAS